MKETKNNQEKTDNTFADDEVQFLSRKLTRTIRRKIAAAEEHDWLESEAEAHFKDEFDAELQQKKVEWAEEWEEQHTATDDAKHSEHLTKEEALAAENDFCDGPQDKRELAYRDEDMISNAQLYAELKHVRQQLRFIKNTLLLLLIVIIFIAILSK